MLFVPFASAFFGFCVCVCARVCVDQPGQDLDLQSTVLQAEEGLPGCQGHVEGRKHYNTTNSVGSQWAATAGGDNRHKCVRTYHISSPRRASGMCSASSGQTLPSVSIALRCWVADIWLFVFFQVLIKNQTLQLCHSSLCHHLGVARGRTIQ